MIFVVLGKQNSKYKFYTKNLTLGSYDYEAKRAIRLKAHVIKKGDESILNLY